jgi:hypothetical protein
LALSAVCAELEELARAGALDRAAELVQRVEAIHQRTCAALLAARDEILA